MSALTLFAALVLVEPELGASCIAQGSAITLKEVEAPKEAPEDVELDDAREWIGSARKAWSEGQELAFRLETNAARAKLEEALVLFGRGAPALEDFGEYARLLIDLGALFVDAKMDGSARDAFKRALVLETRDRPSEKQYPPPVVVRFESVAAELARQPRISVSIVGQPDGAELRWDGRRAGVLPLSIADVLPGEHWLSARHPGKKYFSALVTVTKENNRAEVFMSDAEETRTLEQRALSAALHEGEPTAVESRALAALLEGQSAVLLLARDRSDSTGPCRAVYRIHTQKGTTRLQAMVSPAPFDVAKLLAVDEPQKPRAELVHPVVAIAPFGIGQLAEGRALSGALFLASEGALLATNLVAYGIGRRDRREDGTYADVSRAETLQLVTNIAFGLFIADVVFGAIDGWFHRDEN